MVWHQKRRQPYSNWRPTGEVLEARRVLATIAGSVFVDTNADGAIDPGEPGLPGVVVFLDKNANGVLDRRGFGIEPDDYAAGQVLNHVVESIRASAITSHGELAFRVTARPDGLASTGRLVFGYDQSSTWDRSRHLRFDFADPVDSASIDVTGAERNAATRVTLDAYDGDGKLVGSSPLSSLPERVTKRLSVRHAEQQIAYVIARVTSDNGKVKFDNLRVNDAGSEVATITNAFGSYGFTDVPHGPTIVAQQVPPGYEQTVPFPQVSHQFENISEVARITGVHFANRTGRIAGTAFEDRGRVGIYEPEGPDVPLAGAALYLDLNRNGIPDGSITSVDPDDFVDDEVLDLVSSSVTFSVVDAASQTVAQHVTATRDAVTDPDGKVFAHEGVTTWNNDRRLRVDFHSPASSVHLDFIGASALRSERGVLLAFTGDGKPIATRVTEPIGIGERQNMSIERTGNDIGYVLAYTVDPTGGAGRLDNLRATSISEPVVVTDSDGDFVFTSLTTRTYRVGAVDAPGRTVSFPPAGSYEQAAVFGNSADELEFGFLNTNRPPVAGGDLIVAEEDTPAVINVLVNDQDTDGSLNPSTLTIFEHPLHGTAAVNVDGQIRYTPTADFFGTDTLVYSVLDDLAVESNLAVVTIKVQPVNDPPVASDDNVSTLAGMSTQIGVLRNDADIDGDLASDSLVITQPPYGGTAEVDPSSGTITYVPNLGFSGTDVVRYTVADEQGAVSNVANVFIEVVTSGILPVANDDAATTEEGTSVIIPILVNDTDPDGIINSRTVAITTPPAHGRVTVDEIGQVDYQPELGFVGNDSFGYIVRDNDALSSNEANVQISITEREFPYLNPVNPLDVDGDGVVSPRDALWIVNELNNRQISDPSTGEVIVKPVPPNRPFGYLDVNGDGFIVSGDALWVINFLNAQNAVSEPPPSPLLNVTAVAAAFASGLDEESILPERIWE